MEGEILEIITKVINRDIRNSSLAFNLARFIVSELERNEFEIVDTHKGNRCGDTCTCEKI